MLRPFLPIPVEPFPDSLQISQREFIRTKARGKQVDPLSSLRPRILPTEVI